MWIIYKRKCVFTILKKFLKFNYINIFKNNAMNLSRIILSCGRLKSPLHFPYNYNYLLYCNLFYHKFSKKYRQNVKKMIYYETARW